MGKQTPTDILAGVSQAGRGLPSRMIVHAVEGWGKTSFAAQAPKPIVLMSNGETGLETLLDQGRLPDTPHLPEITAWTDLLDALNALMVEKHDYRTLVLDTVNGFERICYEHVCKTEFNGDWGDKGFLSYMRGYERSIPVWGELLQSLDLLRAQTKMGIIGLVHTKIGTFKNPEGEDYDRYQPDMHQKLWGPTHKWADMVLFGNYEVFTTEKKGAKAKAKGGQRRIAYTEHHAAYDAKNRHGLPPEVDMGESAKSAWENFVASMKKGK